MGMGSTFQMTMSCGEKKNKEEKNLRLNEELHQAGVPTGGSSVQGRPQLAVAGVHAGSSIQQTLHHLHKVIDAALTRQE